MTTIGYTGQFITYMAKSNGVYDIVAYGAQGGRINGSRFGGKRAEIGGDFTCTTDETLTMAVGGAGDSADYVEGGGGDIFVVAPGNAPLAIAAGGGLSNANVKVVGGSQTGTSDDASFSRSPTA